MKNLLSNIITPVTKILGLVNVLLNIFVHRLKNFKFLKLDFNPGKNDIFIVTYPRSGTTLMQFIMYQLISDGNMDFFHISEKIPFLERIPTSRMKHRINGKKRIYKTHLNYKTIPKGKSKYIYILRDGKDVMISYYHHYKNYQNFQGNFNDFFEKFLNGKLVYGSWFDHVSEWLLNREKLDLKLIYFDDLVNDTKNTVIDIAKFCGVEFNDRLIERVVNQCSFENMKMYESKFDHATELLFDNGVKPKNFIRKGKIENWKQVLTEAEIEKFKDVYNTKFSEFKLKFNFN